MFAFEQDPQADLDYVFDFKPFTHGRAGETSDYLATGETIASYVVTVSPGLTKHADSISDGAVTVWLKDGVAGASVTVGCRITTSSSRVDERSITIAVRDQ